MKFNLSIAPTYVSLKEDIFCFLFPHDAPKYSELLFKIPLPLLLKIHESVCTLTESLILAPSGPPNSTYDSRLHYLLPNFVNDTTKAVTNACIAISTHNFLGMGTYSSVSGAGSVGETVLGALQSLL